MKITSITVHAERKFNHPAERFANFGHSISLTATLDPGDTEKYSISGLRSLAEEIAENHKRDILHDCELAETRRGVLRRLYAARQWREELTRLETWAAEHNADLADIPSEDAFNALTEKRRRELLLQWGSSSHDPFAWLTTRLTARRGENLADIERLKAEGPAKLAAIEAELAALPAPRLLPELIAAQKEIHPGHADHPETGVHDYFGDDDS